MIYKVFDTRNGGYSDASSLEDALQINQTIKNEYAAEVYPYLVLDQYLYAEDKQIAENFLQNTSLHYYHSDFNATTKEYVNSVFYNDTYIVKVTNGVVSELYKTNVEINGKVRSYASLNLTTRDPIEYYEQKQDCLIKYDLSGNQIRVYDNNFSNLTQQQKDLISTIKEEKSYWTVKPEGLIVGLDRTVIRTNDELTSEEKAVIDSKREAFLEERKNSFVINSVVKNENGDETWSVVVL